MRFDTAIPASLPSIRTYSFRETTFARRLHRASLEAGYSLALDPTRKPELFNRAFRLSLLIADRAKIASILKKILDRGIDDNLDSDCPLVHIGGAGTHYSRKDKFGVLQPKKQVQTLGIIGPQALSVLQRVSPTIDLSVELSRFEGEWFDPHDVEGYLAEKGIFIDPASSFVEADIEVMSPSHEVSSASFSPELQNPMRGTSEDTSVPFPQDQLEHTGDFDTNNEWADFSMPKMTDIGFSDASTGSWMNFLMPGEAVKQRLPNSTQWDDSVSSQYVSRDPSAGFVGPTETNVRRKKKKLIDVTKFLKGKVDLIDRSTCC